jgi:cephalosporin hydroxylase
MEANTLAGDNNNKAVRLIIAALLIAAVSFAAGAFGVLEYLSLPSERVWMGYTFPPSRLVGTSLKNGFENMLYNRHLWEQETWLGVQVLKYPTDLLVYEEMIYEVQPDVILDIGTYKGGSALYFATLLELIGNPSGRVISVDITRVATLPKHPRITYLLGSSTSEEIFKQIRDSIKPSEKVMVFLDSDHHKQHVLNEIRAYSQIVTKGSYLIVEDSNINGHPVYAGYGPGPMEAIHEFLGENSGFQIDKSREKFLLTVAPDGFLRKL